MRLTFTFTVVKAIDDLIASGCHPNKIILGLPAYGRHGQEPHIVKTYSEIMDEFIVNKKSNANILSLNNYHGILFDSPMMIQDKVNMVRVKGLKGVFLWEIGQDYYSHPDYPGGLLIQSASTFVSKTNDATNNGEL